MRVLHVTTHFNIGGITNYIFSLASAMKADGVDFVVASSGGNMEDVLKKRGVRHLYLDIKTKFEFGPKVFRSAKVLEDIIRNEKIDLIHAHTRVSQVAAFFACRRAGIPYVTTCHGYFKNRLFRRLFDTWGDKVVAISGPVKDHLEKDFHVKSGRIELIHTGVDMARFAKAYSPQEIQNIKRSLQLKDGLVIGTIGRLSPVKGQRFLIEAMINIKAKLPDAQALIIGDGPEEKALKNLSGSLGIGSSVHFLNSQLDTHKFLSIMDVFVFPSVKEGLGMALLEALASAKPCIASDIGGIGDIIKNASTGILVPVGDTRAITKAVLEVLRDKDSSNRLGLNGKKMIEEAFSLNKMALEMKALYGKVLRK